MFVRGPYCEYTEHLPQRLNTSKGPSFKRVENEEITSSEILMASVAGRKAKNKQSLPFSTWGSSAKPSSYQIQAIEKAVGLFYHLWNKEMHELWECY